MGVSYGKGVDGAKEDREAQSPVSFKEILI